MEQKHIFRVFPFIHSLFFLYTKPTRTLLMMCNYSSSIHFKIKIKNNFIFIYQKTVGIYKLLLIKHENKVYFLNCILIRFVFNDVFVRFIMHMTYKISRKSALYQDGALNMKVNVTRGSV